MTIRISSEVPNSESHSGELLRQALVASEPELEHPDICVEILCGLTLPGRQLDLVILYHDPRPPHLQLVTTNGIPIHSFVLIVEVKHHSPDSIRFEGPKLHVRYGSEWKDATDQCDQQTYALKSFQRVPYSGSRRRDSTFVQRAIWLPRAGRSAFDGTPANSSVPVHFAELSWLSLVNQFVVNSRQKSVRTLLDTVHHQGHSLQTLRDLLLHEVRPTRLDLRRVNALTQTRFDSEKTAYIQNLGAGLLVLRGRGGTGKTFALMQIALHLARNKQKSVLVTYNHGLIADINRALHFIRQQAGEDFEPPELMTRYEFTKRSFVQTFGASAENVVIDHIGDLSEREDLRLRALMDPLSFLDAVVPDQCSKLNDRCTLCDEDGRKDYASTWRSICKSYNEIRTEWDYVFVDEGQDWTDEQRDLLYKTFTAKNVVVADGVDQFVGDSRCKWDVDDIPINRRHGLRASRRTKAATCQTVADVARQVGMNEWDLEPDPETHGGRFSVLVEPDPRRALIRGLDLLEIDQQDDPTLRAVDNLVCLPSVKTARGVNYPALFDQAIETKARDSWRGFDDEDRRIYPLRESQLRAVQYHSCRGMEGWTTLCIALDRFYDFQLRNARLDVPKIEETLRQAAPLLFQKADLDQRLALEAQVFAANWLMIPLTRSIDHLVIHISDEGSLLANVLQAVSARSPGAINWVH